MGCNERLPFDVEYIKLRRESMSRDIKYLSCIEQTSYEIQEMDIAKLTQGRIKEKIRSAHRLGWISMTEINDVSIFRGLSENEIFELLG